MVNYESIISLLSIMLILIILFVVLFGCRCPQYYEGFENVEKKKKGQEKFIDEMKEKMENETIGNGNGLSDYEKSILDAFSTGKMNPEKFADLIKKEKFTESNLDNIISYIEKFKGGMDI